MASDRSFMELALKLAAKGGSGTRPNPRVGAVVVRSGRIAGTGFHKKAGGPHAEIFALRRAGSRARGSTLYVTLEPCAHTGRTGPCIEAVRASGVRRVVAAMADPNPKNRGRGLRLLRASGIRTSTGLLARESAELNKVFITWMTKKRPFVTVKVAQSLDGKIATDSGDSRWVSGPEARRWVHRLRADVDAILVGVRTVLKDNPRLTVRGVPASKPPLKVVLDSQLRTPPRARLFDEGRVLIAASTSAPAAREAKLRAAGAEVLRFPSIKGRVNLVLLLKELARREVSHLLIEGGGETVASALKAGAIDRLHLIMAPKIIGGRLAPSSVGGAGIRSLDNAVRLANLSLRRLGEDILVTADLTGPKGR